MADICTVVTLVATLPSDHLSRPQNRTADPPLDEYSYRFFPFGLGTGWAKCAKREARVVNDSEIFCSESEVLLFPDDHPP